MIIVTHVACSRRSLSRARRSVQNELDCTPGKRGRGRGGRGGREPLVSPRFFFVNTGYHAQGEELLIKAAEKRSKRLTDSVVQKCLRLSLVHYFLCRGLFNCDVGRLRRGKKDRKRAGDDGKGREEARLRFSLFLTGKILLHQRIPKPPFSSVWQRDWSLRQECPFWGPFSKKCVFGVWTKG